jgi:hypothetical protein
MTLSSSQTTVYMCPILRTIRSLIPGTVCIRNYSVDYPSHTYHSCLSTHMRKNKLTFKFQTTLCTKSYTELYGKLYAESVERPLELQTSPFHWTWSGSFSYVSTRQDTKEDF